VIIWKYSGKTNKKINSMLSSIKQMNAEYIFIRDMDDNPCITQSKEHVISTGKNVDIKRIIIIEKEIECWYIAGLSSTASKQLKISYTGRSDMINKERFNQLIPKKYSSRLDFMIDILEHFSVSTAKRRNRSFQYLLDDYLPRNL
jgi:hypothetical protein